MDPHGITIDNYHFRLVDVCGVVVHDVSRTDLLLVIVVDAHEVSSLLGTNAKTLSETWQSHVFVMTDVLWLPTVMITELGRWAPSMSPSVEQAGSEDSVKIPAATAILSVPTTLVSRGMMLKRDFPCGDDNNDDESEGRGSGILEHAVVQPVVDLNPVPRPTNGTVCLPTYGYLCRSSLRIILGTFCGT